MFNKCAHDPEAHKPAAATPTMINAIVIAMRIEYSIRELPAWSRHGRRNHQHIICAPHSAHRLAPEALVQARLLPHLQPSSESG